MVPIQAYRQWPSQMPRKARPFTSLPMEPRQRLALAYITSQSLFLKLKLEAIAIATGYTQSAVATAVYTIDLPVTPSLTITPSTSSITTAQGLTLTVAVNGGSGKATPTGTITLKSGSFNAQQTLSSGRRPSTCQRERFQREAIRSSRPILPTRQALKSTLRRPNP